MRVIELKSKDIEQVKINNTIIEVNKADQTFYYKLVSWLAELVKVAGELESASGMAAMALLNKANIDCKNKFIELFGKDKWVEIFEIDDESELPYFLIYIKVIMGLVPIYNEYINEKTESIINKYNANRVGSSI